MRFEVQQLIGNGWENTWGEDTNGTRVPLTFATRDEAQAELDALLSDTGYSRDEYRIVKEGTMR